MREDLTWLLGKEWYTEHIESGFETQTKHITKAFLVNQRWSKIPMNTNVLSMVYWTHWIRLRDAKKHIIKAFLMIQRWSKIPNEYKSFIFVTRVTRLIHDAGKYLLISIYHLPTHPTNNFTHKNGGNLDTLPGWPWPILIQGTLVPYNEKNNFFLYHKNISTESVICDCQQPQLMY